MAQRAVQFVLRHNFNDFNRGRLKLEDHYDHGAYGCKQAVFQPAGKYCDLVYPGRRRTHAEHQAPDGSWPREAYHDGSRGFTCSTSLASLAITPTYQLLPVYQRCTTPFWDDDAASRSFL